jgi:2-polyprenyl-3-methyl-5-hydroxy-6-metoxy-1,4-benzoquinol methylase
MSNQQVELIPEHSYFHQVRHEMLDFVPREAKIILDVGCANGNFAAMIKSQRAAEVWGIEPNQEAAKLATSQLDKVICDTFSRSLSLPNRKFDCIILNDVLEHLVDYEDALIYCKDLLAAEGSIVASIPNVRYFDNIWNLLVNKNWEYQDWGILDRTHLRFFTMKSIINTFENLGLRINTLQGINSLQSFHPRKAKAFKFFNTLLLNQLADMNYLQFAVVAQPKGASS